MPMSQKPTLVADMLSNFERTKEPVQVALTNELVHLLSDQLYQSPLKAVEELVVNAYDAGATECRLYVPLPSDVDKDFIIAFDDGIGMDRDGLTNLWQIGRSNKRDEEIQRRRERKQIGKFGIGKLATYTIANRLTYITRNSGQMLSVTIDFAVFEPSPTGESEPIQMPVWLISSWDKFAERTHIQRMLDAAHIDSSKLSANGATSWTIAILEDLKEKARKITKDRLDWVLSTAMPLRSGFHLYLNGDEVVSSKETYPKAVEFSLAELPKSRLEALSKKTGETWRVKDDSLVSESFGSGILL